MAGLHKQSIHKNLLRSVDMSATAAAVEDAGWERPSADLLDQDTYRTELPGADFDEDRLIIRAVREQVDFQLIEFSLIQMTKKGSKWVEVCEVDSCHDDDVHVHQCGRRAGGRIGNLTPLSPISNLEDVQSAYEVGLDHIEAECPTHKERWLRG